jgi:O-antigen/teichoic acid export membrane protein
MKSVSTSRNVLFGFLGWLLPLGFTVVFTPVIVHGLGAEAYGLYAVIVGVIGYMASLNFNVGRGVTKHIAVAGVGLPSGEAGEVLSAALFLYLIIGVASATLVAIFRDWIVVSVLRIALEYQDHARLALLVGAAGILFTLLSQLLGAVPQALQRFDLSGVLTIGTGIATIGGNGVLVLLGFGFPALVAWNVLVTVFACAAYAAVFRKLLPGERLSLPVRKDLLSELARFGGAVTVYQVAWNALILFERGWIARSLGGEAVTLYVVPMMIGVYLHAFVASITQVVFPMVSEVGASGDVARLEAIYTRALKYVGVASVFLSIAISCGSRPLLSAWMGEAFSRESTSLLQMQAVTFGIFALLFVPWNVADGLGFPWWNALLGVVWLFATSSLAWALTPRFGLSGIAFARLAIAAATVPFYIACVEKRVFGRVRWAFWQRLIVSLAASGGAAAAFLVALFRWVPSGWTGVVLATGSSALVMAAVLWRIGYLDQEEKDWLRQLAFSYGGHPRGGDHQ